MGSTTRIELGEPSDLELSVIVPVYNEAATIIPALQRLLKAPYRKQILICNDGSTDETLALLNDFFRSQAVRENRGGHVIELFSEEQNRGKSHAIRVCVPHITAPYVIIQDADLEYNPEDFPLLIDVLRQGHTKIVYGSRYLSGKNDLPWTHYKLGVKLLNFLTFLLYGSMLTDTATCYKALESKTLQGLDLQSSGFDFCPEVTAKVLRQGHRIVEVPISFQYRTVQQGKKIRWHDGISAIWTLLFYRFARI